MQTKQVGIDLTRHREIVKLIVWRYGAMIRRNGWDVDEIVSVVELKLLVANSGKSPWNPEKSSFGHYVLMVASSAIRNYHRAETRRSPEVLAETDEEFEQAAAMPDLTSWSPEDELIARETVDGWHCSPAKHTKLERSIFRSHPTQRVLASTQATLSL
jgi:DNA-directed RNA polymerase specialized sigma24 family protein